MYEKLLKLLNNSYSKYSNFNVAVILKLVDGTEISGVNVESSSFGATLCAERNAIGTAITNGIEMNKITEVHLIAYSKNKSAQENSIFVMPCGICRQVMREQLGDETKIFIYNYATKNYKIYKNKDLLPNYFSGKEI